MGATWSQFLRAHARAVLACDFLAVDSVRLGVLYVLVFLEIGSRRVIFCNATAHPDSVWVTQQARNVAWELEELKIPIKVPVHDRDSKYNSNFDAVFSAAGIRIARTPFRSSRAQRDRGAARAEPTPRVPDHILRLSERHVRAVLPEFVTYYNEDRPHRSLTLETLAPSPRQPAGRVVLRPILNGLHHVYERAA